MVVVRRCRSSIDPLDLPSIDSRSDDGLDGRRRIGSNPAEGDARSANTPSEPRPPPPPTEPDEGLDSGLGQEHRRPGYSSRHRRSRGYTHIPVATTAGSYKRSVAKAIASNALGAVRKRSQTTCSFPARRGGASLTAGFPRAARIPIVDLVATASPRAILAGQASPTSYAIRRLVPTLRDDPSTGQHAGTV